MTPWEGWLRPVRDTGDGGVVMLVSPLRPLVLVSAVAAIASCTSREPDRAPELDRPVMQPSSPESSAPPRTGEQLALDSARRWAEVWCGWTWRWPWGTREAEARAWMTESAGQQLPGTDAQTWRAEVVAVHEQATCNELMVQVSAGPKSSNQVHVSMTAERVVRSDRGESSSTWSEDRQVVLVNGRWLVDEQVLGG